MSQSGRDPRRKREGKFDIELMHVVYFLRFIAVMTGALFLVSCAAFLLMEKTPATNAVYCLVIAINFVAAGGSLLGAWKLNRKDRELSDRELEQKKAPPTGAAQGKSALSNSKGHYENCKNSEKGR